MVGGSQLPERSRPGVGCTGLSILLRHIKFSNHGVTITPQYFHTCWGYVGKETINK
jgi:hypothetical protein